MSYKSRHNIFFKLIATGVVCLFLFNTTFQGISYADVSYSLAPNHELHGATAEEVVAQFLATAFQTIRSMKQKGTSDEDVIVMLKPWLDRLDAKLESAGDRFRVTMTNAQGVKGSFYVYYDGRIEHEKDFDYDSHEVAMDPQIAQGDHISLDDERFPGLRGRVERLMREIAGDVAKFSPELQEDILKLLARKNKHGRSFIGFVDNIEGFDGHPGKQGIHLHAKYIGATDEVLRERLEHETLGFFLLYRHRDIEAVQGRLAKWKGQNRPESGDLVTALNKDFGPENILPVTERTTKELKGLRDWAATEEEGLSRHDQERFEKLILERTPGASDYTKAKDQWVFEPGHTRYHPDGTTCELGHAIKWEMVIFHGSGATISLGPIDVVKLGFVKVQEVADAQRRKRRGIGEYRRKLKLVKSNLVNLLPVLNDETFDSACALVDRLEEPDTIGDAQFAEINGLFTKLKHTFAPLNFDIEELLQIQSICSRLEEIGLGVLPFTVEEYSTITNLTQDEVPWPTEEEVEIVHNLYQRLIRIRDALRTCGIQWEKETKVKVDRRRLHTLIPARHAGLRIAEYYGESIQRGKIDQIADLDAGSSEFQKTLELSDLPDSGVISADTDIPDESCQLAVRISGFDRLTPTQHKAEFLNANRILTKGKEDEQTGQLAVCLPYGRELSPNCISAAEAAGMELVHQEVVYNTLKPGIEEALRQQMAPSIADRVIQTLQGLVSTRSHIYIFRKTDTADPRKAERIPARQFSILSTQVMRKMAKEPQERLNTSLIVASYLAHDLSIENLVVEREKFSSKDELRDRYAGNFDADLDLILIYLPLLGLGKRGSARLQRFLTAWQDPKISLVSEEEYEWVATEILHHRLLYERFRKSQLERLPSYNAWKIYTEGFTSDDAKLLLAVDEGRDELPFSLLEKLRKNFIRSQKGEPYQGSPAGLFEEAVAKAGYTYKPAEDLVEDLDILASTAEKDLKLLADAGLLRRRKNEESGEYEYMLATPRELPRERLDVARRFLDELFDQLAPETRGNVTKFRSGEGRRYLIAALQDIVRLTSGRVRRISDEGSLKAYHVVDDSLFSLLTGDSDADALEIPDPRVVRPSIREEFISFVIRFAEENDIPELREIAELVRRGNAVFFKASGISDPRILKPGKREFLSYQLGTRTREGYAAELMWHEAIHLELIALEHTQPDIWKEIVDRVGRSESRAIVELRAKVESVYGYVEGSEKNSHELLAHLLTVPRYSGEVESIIGRILPPRAVPQAAELILQIYERTRPSAEAIDQVMGQAEEVSTTLEPRDYAGMVKQAMGIAVRPAAELEERLLPDIPESSPASILSFATRRASKERFRSISFLTPPGVSEDTAERHLILLWKAGLLERRGEGDSAKYRVRPESELPKERLEAAQACLDWFFDRNMPAGKGALTAYRSGEGREKLIAILKDIVEPSGLIRKASREGQDDAYVLADPLFSLFSYGEPAGQVGVTIYDRSDPNYAFTEGVTLSMIAAAAEQGFPGTGELMGIVARGRALFLKASRMSDAERHVPHVGVRADSPALDRDTRDYVKSKLWHERIHLATAHFDTATWLRVADAISKTENRHMFNESVMVETTTGLKRGTAGHALETLAYALTRWRDPAETRRIIRETFPKDLAETILDIWSRARPLEKDVNWVVRQAERLREYAEQPAYIEPTVKDMARAGIEMEEKRRVALHNRPTGPRALDRFLEDNSDNIFQLKKDNKKAKKHRVGGKITRLREALEDTMDALGLRDVLDELESMVVEGKRKKTRLQICVVDELPTFLEEGEEQAVVVGGHASSRNITVIVRKKDLDDISTVVARFFYEMRTRSSLARERFEQADFGTTAEQVRARAKKLRQDFEKENKNLEEMIRQYVKDLQRGRGIRRKTRNIRRRKLVREFAGLKFDKKLSPLGRDLTATAGAPRAYAINFFGSNLSEEAVRELVGTDIEIHAEIAPPAGLDRDDYEQVLNYFRRVVGEAVANNAIPVLLEEHHQLSLPFYQALSEVYPQLLAVVVDDHTDFGALYFMTEGNVLRTDFGDEGFLAYGVKKGILTGPNVIIVGAKAAFDIRYFFEEFVPQYIDGFDRGEFLDIFGDLEQEQAEERIEQASEYLRSRFRGARRGVMYESIPLMVKRDFPTFLLLKSGAKLRTRDIGEDLTGRCVFLSFDADVQPEDIKPERVGLDLSNIAAEIAKGNVVGAHIAEVVVGTKRLGPKRIGNFCQTALAPPKAFPTGSYYAVFDLLWRHGPLTRAEILERMRAQSPGLDLDSALGQDLAMLGPGRTDENFGIVVREWNREKKAYEYRVTDEAAQMGEFILDWLEPLRATRDKGELAKVREAIRRTVGYLFKERTVAVSILIDSLERKLKDRKAKAGPESIAEIEAAEEGLAKVKRRMKEIVQDEGISLVHAFIKALQEEEGCTPTQLNESQRAVLSAIGQECPDLDIDPGEIVFSRKGWVREMLATEETAAGVMFRITDGKQRVYVIAAFGEEVALSSGAAIPRVAHRITHELLYKKYHAGRRQINKREPWLSGLFSAIEHGWIEMRSARSASKACRRPEVKSCMGSARVPSANKLLEKSGYENEITLVRAMLQAWPGEAESAIEDFLAGNPETLRGLLGESTFDTIVDVINKRVPTPKMAMTYESIRVYMIQSLLVLEPEEREEYLEVASMLLDAVSDVLGDPKLNNTENDVNAVLMVLSDVVWNEVRHVLSEFRQGEVGLDRQELGSRFRQYVLAEAKEINRTMTTGEAEPTTFFFDIGGVILGEVVTGIAEQLVPHCKSETTATELRAAILGSESVHRYQVGEIGDEEFFEGLKAECDLADDFSYEEFVPIWTTAREPKYEVVKLIRMLRFLGHRVCIITDSNALHCESNLRHFPILREVDGFVSSHQVGRSKGDGPEIFMMAMQEVGASPQNSVFVDDNQPNVDIAQQAGMRAYRFEDLDDLIPHLPPVARALASQLSEDVSAVHDTSISWRERYTEHQTLVDMDLDFAYDEDGNPRSGYIKIIKSSRHPVVREVREFFSRMGKPWLVDELLQEGKIRIRVQQPDEDIQWEGHASPRGIHLVSGKGNMDETLVHEVIALLGIHLPGRSKHDTGEAFKTTFREWKQTGSVADSPKLRRILGSREALAKTRMDTEEGRKYPRVKWDLADVGVEVDEEAAFDRFLADREMFALTPLDFYEPGVNFFEPDREMRERYKQLAAKIRQFVNGLPSATRNAAFQEKLVAAGVDRCLSAMAGKGEVPFAESEGKVVAAEDYTQTIVFRQPHRNLRIPHCTYRISVEFPDGVQTFFIKAVNRDERNDFIYQECASLVGYDMYPRRMGYFPRDSKSEWLIYEEIPDATLVEELPAEKLQEDEEWFIGAISRCAALNHALLVRNVVHLFTQAGRSPPSVNSIDHEFMLIEENLKELLTYADIGYSEVFYLRRFPAFGDLEQRVDLLERFERAYFNAYMDIVNRKDELRDVVSGHDERRIAMFEKSMREPFMMCFEQMVSALLEWSIKERHLETWNQICEQKSAAEISSVMGNYPNAGLPEAQKALSILMSEVYGTKRRIMELSRDPKVLIESYNMLQWLASEMLDGPDSSAFVQDVDALKEEKEQCLRMVHSRREAWLEPQLEAASSIEEVEFLMRAVGETLPPQLLEGFIDKLVALSTMEGNLDKRLLVENVTRTRGVASPPVHKRLRQHKGLTKLIFDIDTIPTPMVNFDSKTLVLRETLDTYVKDGQRVLEIGPGSNATLSNYLAGHKRNLRVLGAEINPQFVETSRQAVELNGLGGTIQIVESDVVSNVEGEHDVAFWNIPFVTASAKRLQEMRPGLYDFMLEYATEEDEGLNLIRRFLAEVPANVAADGKLIFASNISYVPEKEIRRLIAESGLRLVRTVGLPHNPSKAFVLKFKKVKEGDAAQIYRDDALVARDVLNDEHVKADNRRFVVSIGKDATTEERQAMRAQAETIEGEKGIKIEIMEPEEDIGATYVFECWERVGKKDKFVGRTRLNLQQNRHSLDRTLAILNIGLAAATVPKDLTDDMKPNYQGLLKYINDQYKLLDMIGRDLLDTDAPTEEIVQILYANPITIILPPVKKHDFDKKMEFELQMQKLREFA